MCSGVLVGLVIGHRLKWCGRGKVSWCACVARGCGIGNSDVTREEFSGGGVGVSVGGGGKAGKATTLEGGVLRVVSMERECMDSVGVRLEKRSECLCRMFKGGSEVG